MLHILYENEDWRPPLEAALSGAGLAHRFWSLVSNPFDLEAPPPDGLYWSRMSASAGDRGHGSALDVAEDVLRWLESHGRTVINGSRALALERSKVDQDAALRATGIKTPKTLAAETPAGLFDAARNLGMTPFIIKPDCGGKGAGVRLMESLGALDAALAGGALSSASGRWLVQDYIRAPSKTVIRSEFVGGRLLYAVEVDASAGFELCPADACDIGGAPKFQILKDYDSPLIELYEAFLAANGIAIAGIEHMINEDGQAITYDVNVNTNYNSEAEAAADRPGAGMAAVTRYLTQLLKV